MSRSPQRSILLSASLLAIALAAVGCGGGSSGAAPSQNPAVQTPSVGDPPQNQPISNPVNDTALPVVAKTRVMPLEILTISVPTARPGSTHRVRFSSNNGFDLSYDIQAEQSGEISLSTPFPLDNPSTAIDLSVSVDGQIAASSITVQALPEVDGDAGALTLVFLERIATTYDDVSYYLEELPFTTPGFQTTERIVQASIRADDKVDEVADIYFAIEAGAESVQLFPGTRISLDAAFLRQMDRWILAMAMAVAPDNRQSDQLSNPALSSRARIDKVQAERQVREMMDAVRGIQDLQETAPRAAKEAAERFFQVFGTAFGVISLAPQVIVAESTATLSGVAGIAMTYLSTLTDFAIGTMHSAMAKGVREGNRLSFEASKLLDKKLDEFLLAYCGARTGDLGKACTVYSLLKDRLTVPDELIVAACSQVNDLVGGRISDFCGMSPPVTETPTPPVETPEQPAQTPGTSQVIPTQNLCPAELGSRNGASLTLADFSRTSSSSHHCRYKWATSGDVSTPIIIYYTTEEDMTSRPRTQVFCTGSDGSDESVLVADLSSNAFARTRVGSNLRQVQVEGQAQFFNVQELTSILRDAVAMGIGNDC